MKANVLLIIAVVAICLASCIGKSNKNQSYQKKEVQTSFELSPENEKMILFEGKYLDIQYPSSWSVNKSPGTYTADIYIGNSDHSFGVWIFRFEQEDLTFEENHGTIGRFLARVCHREIHNRRDKWHKMV